MGQSDRETVSQGPAVVQTTARIRERLAALEPEALEIADESQKHVGHAGAAGGGGHFQLTIVSKHFSGKSPVARHRMIYSLLADLMQREVHALSIEALTPDQI